MSFVNQFERAWNSPTIMTWMSYLTKTLSLFVVIPLILKFLSVEDISLWYLFSTIIALQGVADFGFKNTFVRFIAYTDNGSSISFIEIEDSKHPLIDRIYSIMRFIYVRLSVVLFLLLIIFGSLLLVRPINLSDNVFYSWIAWGIIIVTTIIKFYYTCYSNFLEGRNKIALVRRWEGIMSLGASITSIIVVLIFKNLIALVIANQIWVLLNVLRNYVLVNNINSKEFNSINKKLPFESKLFKQIWTPSWKSGLSGIMSTSLTSIMSLVYAQFGDSKAIAAYLLAIRLITQIKEVSMAPFYSKIPKMANLFSQNKLIELVKIAKRGMALAHMIFIMGVISIGLTSDYLLKIIGSNVDFVENDMWLLLSFAFFVHRFGAMHIQLYSITNHIISHIADGVSGVLFIISTLLLKNVLYLYALPIGMLIGYLGFYSWFAAKYSYKFVNEKWYHFEMKSSLIPFSIFVLYVCYELWFFQ